MATLYDYGSATATLHVFLSTGSSFTSQGTNGWWASSSGGYDANKVIDITSGDYNGDGLDDVAIIYYYGSFLTRAHVFLSNGTTFISQGTMGWWSAPSYDGNRVKGVASGDFDNNGKDDIALVYYYGSLQTRVHTLMSNGSSFSTGTWHTNPSYDGNKIKGVVAGDYNGDNKDDLAMIYYYGSLHTRIHTLISSGSNFSISTWQILPSYDGNKIKEAVSGDFNNNGRDDISLVYYYGSLLTRAHTFLSNGSQFMSQGTTGWLSLPSYDGNRIKGGASGDFNGDGNHDLALLYYYGYNGTVAHTFLSNTQRFISQGSDGWWGCRNPIEQLEAKRRTESEVGGNDENYINEERIQLSAIILDENQEVNIYPNPNKGQFTLDLTEVNNTENSISIYNSIGKKIDFQQTSSSHNVKQINLSTSAKGLYFIQITYSNQIIMKKIIID